MQGEWLREPSGDTTVVFVHGILSSGEECWRHKNGSYWPNLLIEEPDLLSVGVYVYTYKTGVFSGRYTLGDAVDDLKERLFKLDEVADSKKLIFVCHSMGGIVVRKLIVDQLSELKERNNEIGLFLVASPNLGSDYANWLAPIAKLMGHTQAKLLESSPDNQWLNDLSKNFKNLKEHQKLKLYGKELLEDEFIAFPELIHKQVVEPFSGAYYFADPIKIANTNHFSIAKPENSKSDQHRYLKIFINELHPQALQTLIPNHPNQLRPDSQFQTKIKQNIAAILDAPKNQIFTNKLKTELDKVLTTLTQENVPDYKGLSMADTLVTALRLGGNPPIVITKALMNSTTACLGKQNKEGLYIKDAGEREKLKKDILELLGWLVLSAVDDHYSSNLTNSDRYPLAEYFELPVVTPVGVEVIVSRYYQRTPNYKPEGTLLTAPFVMDACSCVTETNWTTAEPVEQLKVLLWNQVFDDRQKKMGEYLDADDLDELNAELGTRRSLDGDLKEHYLIAFKHSHELDDNRRSEIYRRLLQSLENLTLVRFGNKDHESVFYVPERSLMSAIRLFVTQINTLTCQ